MLTTEQVDGGLRDLLGDSVGRDALSGLIRYGISEYFRVKDDFDELDSAGFTPTDIAIFRTLDHLGRMLAEPPPKVTALPYMDVEFHDPDTGAIVVINKIGSDWKPPHPVIAGCLYAAYLDALYENDDEEAWALGQMLTSEGRLKVGVIMTCANHYSIITAVEEDE